MTRESDREPRPPRLDAADVLPLIAAIVVLVLVGALLIPAGGAFGGLTGAIIARLVAKVAGLGLVLVRLPWGAAGAGEGAERGLHHPFGLPGQPGLHLHPFPGLRGRHSNHQHLLAA